MAKREPNHELTVDELARSFVLAWLKAKGKKGLSMTFADICIVADIFHKELFQATQRPRQITTRQDNLSNRKIMACHPTVIQKAVKDLQASRRIYFTYNGFYHISYGPKIRTIDDDWDV